MRRELYKVYHKKYDHFDAFTFCKNVTFRRVINDHLKCLYIKNLREWYPCDVHSVKRRLTT